MVLNRYPFEENIKMAIDQIERLQKKNNTIRDILPQIFGDSKITIKKFSAKATIMLGINSNLTGTISFLRPAYLL